MPTEEQLQSIEEKIEQLKAKKQKLISQIKTKERKERTRRIIQSGAIFEKYFEIQSLEEADYIAQALQAQAKELLAKRREESKV